MTTTTYIEEGDILSRLAELERTVRTLAEVVAPRAELGPAAVAVGELTGVVARQLPVGSVVLGLDRAGAAARMPLLRVQGGGWVGSDGSYQRYELVERARYLIVYVPPPVPVGS